MTKMKARNINTLSCVKFVFFALVCTDILTPIFGMNMWTSLDNRPVKKQCVSPCKIFHTWCKNNGRCREKGADCTWYCECPENCKGFFCEKKTNGSDSGVPAGGETFEVKVVVEKEKKKKVSTFDKSKLAQALAGIILNNDATPSKPGESKAESPQKIDRIDTGGEILVKENVTKTIIINCPPGVEKNNTSVMTDKSLNTQNVSTSTTVPPMLIENAQEPNGSHSTPSASSTPFMTSATSTDPTVMSEGSNQKTSTTEHRSSAGKTSELLEIIEKVLEVERITASPSSPLSETTTTTAATTTNAVKTTTTAAKTTTTAATTTAATTNSASTSSVTITTIPTTASIGTNRSVTLNKENNKDKTSTIDSSMDTSLSEGMSSSVINNDHLARSAINMTTGANDSHKHVSTLATSLSKMDGNIRTAESEPPPEVLSAPIIVDKVKKKTTDKIEHSVNKTTQKQDITKQTTISTSTTAETMSTSTHSVQGLDNANNDISMKETEKRIADVDGTSSEGSGFPPREIVSSSTPQVLSVSDKKLSTQKQETSTMPSTSKPTEIVPKSNAVHDNIRKVGDSETLPTQTNSTQPLLPTPVADTTTPPETTTNTASVPTISVTTTSATTTSKSSTQSPEATSNTEGVSDMKRVKEENINKVLNGNRSLESEKTSMPGSTTTTTTTTKTTTEAPLSTSTQKLTSSTTSTESTSTMTSPSSTTTPVVSTQTTPAPADSIDMSGMEKANSTKEPDGYHGASGLIPTYPLSPTTSTQSTSTTTDITSTSQISSTTAESTHTSESSQTSSSVATTLPKMKTLTSATTTIETPHTSNSTSATTTTTPPPSSSTGTEHTTLKASDAGTNMDIKPIVGGGADVSTGSTGHFKDFPELRALSNKLSESVKDIKLDQIKQELLDKNIPLNELNNIL